MAFKMKNPSMAKMVKAAGNNRAAMKMKMEEKAAAAKMKKEAAMKMEKASAMKKDERSYFQRLKDEAKQIGKGVLGASDALNEPMGDGIPNDPIKGFKRAYKKEEDKQAAKRKGNAKSKSATKMKKSPIKAEVQPKSESQNAKRKAARDEYYRLKKEGTDKSLRKAKGMEVENKHGFYTQIKKNREGGAATKMKKASPAKQKMNMVKGPDGNMVPDFAVDGKGANDMKSGMKLKKGDIKKDLKGGREMLAAKKNPGKPRKVGTSVYTDTYQGTGDTKATRKAEKKFAKAEKKLAKGNLKAAARKVKKGRKAVISMPSGRTTRS